MPNARLSHHPEFQQYFILWVWNVASHGFSFKTLSGWIEPSVLSWTGEFTPYQQADYNCSTLVGWGRISGSSTYSPNPIQITDTWWQVNLINKVKKTNRKKLLCWLFGVILCELHWKRSCVLQRPGISLKLSSPAGPVCEPSLLYVHDLNKSGWQLHGLLRKQQRDNK